MNRMETKKLPKGTDEEIKQWIETNLPGKILILFLKKKKISEKTGVSMQSLFTDKKHHAYGMYINYCHCLEKENPYMVVEKVILNNKNELIIYGHSQINTQKFAINKDQISTKKDIYLV